MKSQAVFISFDGASPANVHLGEVERATGCRIVHAVTVPIDSPTPKFEEMLDQAPLPQQIAAEDDDVIVILPPVAAHAEMVMSEISARTGRPPVVVQMRSVEGYREVAGIA